MIIFGNRKASRLEVYARNGSPIGWPTYRPASILEVGCGYGKLLKRTAAPARHPIGRCRLQPDPTAIRLIVSWEHDCNIELLLSRGERLPFADHSFDMVVTSAVILHNPPAIAERIRREVMRVTRRFAAHNEETNLSYNRYGYDTALWYRQPGRRPGRVRPDSDGPGPVGFTVLRRRDRPWRA